MKLEELYMLKKLSLLLAFIAFCQIADAAKVITYPVPETEKIQTIFKVSVNGKPVDLYRAHSAALNPSRGMEYYFCYFDFEGEVDVRITSQTGFGKSPSHVIIDPAERKKRLETIVAEVLPSSINADISVNEIKFKKDKPFTAIILREKLDMPLIIFGNPIEKDVPNPNDPNVVYFGPGVHFIDKPIVLKDNQTLYLAGGAVVKSNLPDNFPFIEWQNNTGFYEVTDESLFAKCPNFFPFSAWNAKNVSIRGRGIISFDNRARFRNHGLLLNNCQNLKIEGVILRDCNTWTLDLRNCNNVDVDNIKICGSRMINDDAIDICNSSNVVIRNSFCRAQDDIIAIKGIIGSGKCLGRKITADPLDKNNNLPVENIFIEDCIFWTDSANIFRIGYECDAPYFKNIKAKNILVPSYARGGDPRDEWSNAIVWIQPSKDMVISDVEIDGITIRANRKECNLLIANPRIVHYTKTYGIAENCVIKNVNVFGDPRGFKGTIFVEGVNDKYHANNIKLENINYFDTKITKESECVHHGEYANGFEIR